MSYHRWTDESDRVGEAADNHLPSLRLELGAEQREREDWIMTKPDPCLHFPALVMYLCLINPSEDPTVDRRPLTSL